MGYCRLEKNTVVEIFPFNPFEWIPNDKFLADCMECPDDIKIGHIYKDGVFVDSTAIPYEPTPEERIATVESENKLLKAQLQAQIDRNDFIEDCIAEMAMQVYA